MPWNEARSRKRIQNHLETVPEFDERLTLLEYSQLRSAAQISGDMDRRPIRRAFPSEGAHLYGQLLDFDDLVAEPGGTETEASHRNILAFLHMHYQIWDSIVEGEDADRVDYHGGRLHAVVTSPPGNPGGQVARAVALAQKLTEASNRVSEVYGFGPGRVRFGVDQGPCLVMSTGRGHEKDTLFLGSPANHAAKLAAAEDEAGIFLTTNAASKVGSNNYEFATGGHLRPRHMFVEEAVRNNPFAKFEMAVESVTANASKRPSFVFRRRTPPLSSVKFADLSPSASIRMGMASVFADVDGYTAFVDGAIASGPQGMAHAARCIHVIREELNDVLRSDFGGKRVRFIGDCIHGVMAEGKTNDEPTETVTEAVLCASGMRESFELCREIVGGMNSLGLAIGVEYGQVPLTRLGSRGTGSVRCAAAKAMVVAEAEQQSIDGEGIKLGPKALSVATAAVKLHFAFANQIMPYDDAADLLGSLASPAVQIVRDNSTSRSYCSTI